MRTLLWKLIVLTLFLCVFQVSGNEDKNGKSLSKTSDFKAKLSRTQLYSETVDSSTHETIENASISALGITVPLEESNDTVQFDHYTYYNSTFYASPEAAKQFWINLDSFPSTKVHEMLSNSHRQATTVNLTFEFPFYGSILNNVTIATGGFLYMGSYLHNWIAATQYVAPLMANFDPSQSSNSIIKYADNGTAFTVEWSKVYIKNKMEDGAFTFQVTLFKNGDIVFAYKEIPYPITNISDSSHPVKIGISDAYVLERSLFFIRRKTIYEYHRVNMLHKKISNDTALYLTALPTCISYKDCNTCLAADPKLECMWCQAVKRCSDGVDRMRQSWLANSCSLNIGKTCPHINATSTDKSEIVTASNKGLTLTSPNSAIETSTKYFEKSSTSNQISSSTYRIDPPSNEVLPHNPQNVAQYIQEDQSATANISVGAIVTIVLFILALISTTGWIIYAYKFPQTPSGQFLIKYRPSQWSLRKEDNSVTSNSRHL